MTERESNFDRSSAALTSEREQLRQWRKDCNYELANVPLLLAVKRGQIEMPLGEDNPHIEGAVLIMESTISKLNTDIGVHNNILNRLLKG